MNAHEAIAILEEHAKHSYGKESDLKKACRWIVKHYRKNPNKYTGMKHQLVAINKWTLKEVARFDSVKQASLHFGINSGNIYSTLQGRRGSTWDMYFRWEVK